MSEPEGKHNDGAREVAEAKVDPFTKIRFRSHEGLMALAPIRLGVLKEIAGVNVDVTGAKQGQP